MHRVQKLVEQSAACDLPVLITGEVGVGKDVVAREIHRRSARRGRDLLEINGASLPHEFFDGRLPNRAASPLHTVDRSRPSLLETIDGGTLFLDDIGELSPALQDRLLQLLRRGDAPRVGSEDGRRVDFRLIGATHRDLSRPTEAGSFNEELYYRVNLIHIHVPPLRTHLEDIPALLRHFMQVHGEREGWQGEVPEDMLARFRVYEWPGNVCELENAVRRFFALRDPAYVLEELDAQSERCARRLLSASANGHEPPANGHGPPSNGHRQPTNGHGPPSNGHGPPTNGHEPPTNGHEHPTDGGARSDGGQHVDLKELGRRASAVAEREAIREMLVWTQGNKKEAAQRLGISYKALLYKIRDFGLRGAHRARSSEESADRASLTRA